MTLTEIDPAETALVPAPEAMAPAVYQRVPKNIFADGVSSGDHKVIGRLWILGSLLFGLFAVLADILVRFERTGTGSRNSDGDRVFQVFSSLNAYDQWFSLQRVSLVFLFVVPLLIGIAMTMVPLQLGAPSVAFPRAAAAALWTWAVSGVILVVSWAIDGGFVEREGAVSQATQLSMVAFGAVVLAILAASMVIVTTIFTERSKGMSLYNVPLFTWSMLVACSIWLLSLPVLVANLMVMWVDARGPAAQGFGNSDLYGQIAWVFDQPQVFAFAIPVLGMIGELIPVAVRRRLKQYDLAMIAIGAFGAFSFGAYAQTFFNPGANSTWLYVLGSIALLLPVLLMLGTVGLTVKAAAQRPTITTHLGLALMGLVALLAAGAVALVRVLDSLLTPILRATNWTVGFARETIGGTEFVRQNEVESYSFDELFDGSEDGILTLSDKGADVLGDARILDMAGELSYSQGANPALLDANNNPVVFDRSWDWLRRLHDWIGTTFNEVADSSVSGAMLQLTLVAGLLAGISGIFYWAPKIWGRKLPASLGLLAGLSILGGALVSALPDAITGFMNTPARRKGASSGQEALNWISFAGALGILGGLGLVALALLGSVFMGKGEHDVDDDSRNPWGGHTLEWLTESPPPVGNFDGPLVVTSEAPLLDDDFENPYAKEGASA